MRKAEISVIPCSAEIDLNGIMPVGNQTEINWTSETRKLRGNLTEILTEMFNRHGTGNNLEIPKRNGNSSQNHGNFFIYTRSVIFTTSLIWTKITSFDQNFRKCPKFLIISDISGNSGNFVITEQFR